MRTTFIAPFLLLAVCLVTGAPRSESDDNVLNETSEYFDDIFKIYTAEHEIVSLKVPINAVNLRDDADSDNDDDAATATLFFALADIGRNGHRVDKESRMTRRAADPEPETDYEVLADGTADEQNDADAENAEEETEDYEIYNKGENFSALIGQTVRLPCNVSSPDAVVIWTKDGTSYFVRHIRVSAPPKVTRDDKHGFDIIIKDIALSDVGTYECRIAPSTKNPEKEIVHTLKLKEAAKILNMYVSINGIVNNGLVNEGTDVEIVCQTSGTPTLTVIWSRETRDNKGNVRLAPKDAEFYEGGIRMKNITQSQAGKYICYVTNDIGNPAAADVTIKVLGKPRMHAHRTVVNSMVGVEAILECTAHKEPASIIHWFKDKQHLEESEKYSIKTEGQHSTLKFTPFNHDDFGNFTCLAENMYGSHEKSIKLVESPVIDKIVADGPKVHFDIHSHQPLQLIEMEISPANLTTWKKVHIPVPERNHSYLYEVEYDLNKIKLEPGKYIAHVRARNSVAWNDLSQTFLADLDSQPLIQSAGFGGNSAMRPKVAIFSTFFMYLLIRIL